MTYLDIVSHLINCGSDAPEFEAAELVRVFLGKSRQWCLLNRDTPFDCTSDIERALNLRRKGTPLQYITGEVWFYGNKFAVTPDCLIPQPDTEHAVESVLKHIRPGDTLLDLCTGSGCIAVSVLNERKDVKAIAVDISAPALDVARRNAALHGCSERIRFIESDVFEDSIIDVVRNANVIVSNPPYINTDVLRTLSAEVQSEPVIALDGGSDGLRFYRRLILELSKHMKPDAVMILEIGYDQSEKIRELCRLAGLNVTFRRDFGKNIRVAEISRVNTAYAE